MKVTVESLLLIAFSALASSRNIVSNRNRYGGGGGGNKVMHSQMSPLIIQEFGDWVQYENSPIRRDRSEQNPIQVYLLNSKSKLFRSLNHKDLINPESKTLLKDPVDRIQAQNGLQENSFMLGNTNKKGTGNRYIMDAGSREQLSPLFDADEIKTMSGVFANFRDSNAPQTVYNFGELVD